MSKILKTNVIPIEYNNRTEKKAKRIKRILEQNPLFFREFLSSQNIISCIDERKELYIPRKDSIFHHLEGITEEEAKNILELQSFNAEDKAKLLLYMLNEEYEGDYQMEKIEKEELQQEITYIYYCDRKDYKGLYSYILNPSTKKVTEALAWLNENYRFSLLNYLVERQLELLKQTYLRESKEDVEKQLTDMLKIMVLEDLEVEEIEPEYKKITYPMTKEKSITLVKEFLIEIDPSLNWLEKFCEALKNNVFLDTIEEWECIEGPDNNWYIATPWQETLEDAIDMVHEIIHYFSCIGSANHKNSRYTLSELPSLFFEDRMCEFLIKKGYPKEEVEKYRWNRTVRVAKYCEKVEDRIIHMKDKQRKTVITLETEKDRNSLEAKELGISSEELAIESCEDNLYELITSPTLLLDAYPYIIGRRYAKTLLTQIEENEDIIPKMVSITNKIKDRKKDDILNELGLSPPSKKEVTEKIKKLTG